MKVPIRIYNHVAGLPFVFNTLSLLTYTVLQLVGFLGIMICCGLLPDG